MREPFPVAHDLACEVEPALDTSSPSRFSPRSSVFSARVVLSDCEFANFSDAVVRCTVSELKARPIPTRRMMSSGAMHYFLIRQC